MHFDLDTVWAHVPEPALPQAAKQVLALADQHRLAVYMVGGFVRDLLLGIPPDDFDIVVEGHAATLAHALTQAHNGRMVVHPTFRTATWHTAQGASLDLASARTEHYPQAASLPVVHTPARIEDDLYRRDFTFNALALALNGPRPGHLLDPLGGQADLHAGLVRTLHSHSFVDDPTRIFRAVRYASRLQFHIESTTQAQLSAAVPVIPLLSGDRVRHEFEVIFKESQPAPVLHQLASTGALAAVHPALHWSPAAMAQAAGLPALPAALHPLAWWGLLLHQASPAQAEHALKRLNVPRATHVAVVAALALHDCPSQPSAAVHRLEAVPPAALAVAGVLHPQHAATFARYQTVWQPLPPLLTGDDLRAWGFKPGPAFKEVLWRVRAAQIEGHLTTRTQAEALARALLQTQHDSHPPG